MTEAPRAVFVCHASRDAEAADRIRVTLEDQGIPCWIAPRDIPPGSTWAGAILQGIRSSELMLVLVTEASNASVQVVREVERALHHGRPLLPVRLSAVLPTDDLEYFVSAAQWFDAFPAPLANHGPRLAASVRAVLAGRAETGTVLPGMTSESSSSSLREAAPAQVRLQGPVPSSVPVSASSAAEVPATRAFEAAAHKTGWRRPRTDTLVFGLLVVLALAVLVWALSMDRQPGATPTSPDPALEVPAVADRPGTAAPSASAAPSAPVDPPVLTNGIGMHLRYVPPQTFRMGSEQIEDERTDERAHQVTLSRGFYLGTTEVTVRQFREFCGDAVYETVAERQGGGDYSVGAASYERDPALSWRTPGFAQTDEHPVVFVAYQDALAFCGWLGRRENGAYRLPTEAEWEVACRAGSPADYPWGDDPEGGAGCANVCAPEPGRPDRFAFDDRVDRTAPVASFRPNAWGFYDTVGNVMEWCRDWHEPFGSDPRVDPMGPTTGGTRVLRGGAWFSTPRRCRSAHRFRSPEDRRTAGTGFRVALDPP